MNFHVVHRTMAKAFGSVALAFGIGNRIFTCTGKHVSDAEGTKSVVAANLNSDTVHLSVGQYSHQLVLFVHAIVMVMRDLEIL